MIRLGLIGFPLAHSKSPAIHRAAFAALGIDGDYQLYPIPDGSHRLESIKRYLYEIRQGRLTGLNVTIPMKHLVIPYLDQLTPVANAIGAVNTIYRLGDRLIGDNTDAPGFLADLRNLNIPSPEIALVLGAGGGARAVVYALLHSGWDVRLAARRLSQAEEVKFSFSEKAAIPQGRELLPLSLQKDVLAQAVNQVRLVVNATPLGKTPESDSCPWPEGLSLPNNAALYDLIYNPPLTRFLLLGQSQGLQVRNGLGMLVEQAALAYKQWLGLDAPRTAMYEAALDALNNDYG